MAFSIWIPIIVTVLVLFYLFVVGRFVPGIRDELWAFAFLALIWVLYIVFSFVEGVFSVVFGSTTNILILVALIVVVMLIVKFVREKRR